MNPLKRLYHWVLKLADHPAGATFLFLIAFAESSFFPIPPDVLLIPLILGALTKAWRLAALCTLGSVLGGSLGWWIGHTLWWSSTPPELNAAITRADFTPFALFCFDNLNWVGLKLEKFIEIKGHYHEHGPLYVFVAGFSPIPYKLFTIASGAFDMNFASFVGASAVGRAGRFFLVAGLLRWKGEAIRVFIEKRFNVLSILLALALVGGFVLLKYLPTDHADHVPPPATR